MPVKIHESGSAASPLSRPHPEVMMWFGLSFIAPLYFGLISFGYVSLSNDVIQDDARLHIVWLQRLIDPALFPDDAIAHYYAATQAAGFKVVYAIAASIGVAPLELAKLLPLGLALITTAYVFWVTLLILPVPMSGTMTTLILNQNVWLKDDLISATPRAFVYPIFAAFLYYVLRGSGIGSLIALVLLGLFYPQMMLVAFGVLTLRLLPWSRWFQNRTSIHETLAIAPRRLNHLFSARPFFSMPKDWRRSWSLMVTRRAVLTWLIALVMTVGLLLFFSHRVEAQAGPLISLTDMLSMPEFGTNGRREYFGVPPLQFAFSGASGLRFPLFPPIIVLGAALPVVRRSFQSLVPTGLTPDSRILAEILLSALGLFFLAHAIFPTLYLPSRYTFYSVRFVMAIATGLVLTLVLHKSWNWLKRRQQSIVRWTKLDRLKAILGVVFAIAVITVPAIPSLFLSCHGWVVGQMPAIYQMLAQRPKDTLVASIVPEVSNVPAFSQRSVLVAEEFAIPYHAQFYTLMTERMTNLLHAQYSSDLSTVQTWIQTSGADVWIVDQAFAEPEYLIQQAWLLNSSIRATVMAVHQQLLRSLDANMQPALVATIPSCTIVTDANFIALDTSCISQLGTVNEGITDSVVGSALVNGQSL
ncbi:MAG: hypothetical protein AAFU78_19135 [Cyanobacteria bacterium J06633_2]